MLTEQKKAFIEEYLKLKCKNMTQAAIAAGYSPRSASSQASTLLKNTEVLSYLHQRKSEIQRELQEEFIFDALEAKKVLYDIMMSESASDRDRITAAKDFLDRAGFTPENKVRMSGEMTVYNPYDELSVAELKALARMCENEETG